MLCSCESHGESLIFYHKNSTPGEFKVLSLQQKNSGGARRGCEAEPTGDEVLLSRFELSGSVNDRSVHAHVIFSEKKLKTL